MDAWSRSIVGWRMSDSLHASVTLDALRMEVVRRNPPRGLVHGRRFRTHEEARLAVFERIEVWHQRTRIHGSLGYVSPEALEAAARAGWDQDEGARVAWKSTSSLTRRASLALNTCSHGIDHALRG